MLLSMYLSVIFGLKFYQKKDLVHKNFKLMKFWSLEFYSSTNEILKKPNHRHTDFFLFSWLGDCCWFAVIFIVKVEGNSP